MLALGFGCDTIAVEAKHVFGNGEVPGFKPVHLGFGQILQISFSSRPSEEDIVLRPENDGFRLSLLRKACHLG
jgi:hypothetical protein